MFCVLLSDFATSMDIRIYNLPFVRIMYEYRIYFRKIFIWNRRVYFCPFWQTELLCVVYVRFTNVLKKLCSQVMTFSRFLYLIFSCGNSRKQSLNTSRMRRIWKDKGSWVIVNVRSFIRLMAWCKTFRGAKLVVYCFRWMWSMQPLQLVTEKTITIGGLSLESLLRFLHA